ncbi:MAG TPA: ABC transporter permease [Rubrivivax sp.]|nr:ABC transporter permease [Burkholderiales bacterium]HNT37733.1 ABC transporter permease [Rubrivivax sp.]
MDAPKALDSDAVRWSRRGQGWQLALQGDWRGCALPLPEPPVPGPGAGESVVLDSQDLSGWDRNAAPRLWALLAPLRRGGAVLDLSALPEALRAPLELALPAPGSAVEAVPEHVDDGGILGKLRAGWEDALQTAAFVGEVVLALSRLLRGKAAMRASDYFRQLDLVGPMSLPIVSLTCFLIGLMLAYMGGAQLERIGAQSFIADVVTVGMVRELAGLMTGVILAGRVGAAFAAQLGSMRANEEIDALRALGIDPIDYLVLPRLLAMLTMAPLLIAYAALVGVLAGLPPVVGIYGVPAWEYLHECEQAMTWTHLWIGLFKGTMYIGLVALAGCREGLHAGRDAQSVGAATTTAVVKGLLWIVVAASASTVLFQSLGF